MRDGRYKAQGGTFDRCHDAHFTQLISYGNPFPVGAILAARIIPRAQAQYLIRSVKSCKGLKLRSRTAAPILLLLRKSPIQLRGEKNYKNSWHDAELSRLCSRVILTLSSFRWLSRLISALTLRTIRIALCVMRFSAS
jgi:hypothetical protein